MHTRVVRVLRILLPATMVGMVFVLAGLVVNHAVRRQAAVQKDASTSIRMVNPHFYGRDSRGRAYTLGAQDASRDESSLQTVLLRLPSLILDMESVHPSRLSADTGIYHQDTRILILKGHVRGTDANNSNFATDQAVVNTRTGTVNSDSRLAGRTAAGEVSSQKFDVYDKGNRVVFKGGVHARLNQK